MKQDSHGVVFDLSRVKTYPLKVRGNKVDVGMASDLEALRASAPACSAAPWFRNGRPGAGPDQSAGLRELAGYIVDCHRNGRPVVVMTGAHPIKNGQIALIVDLIERGVVTLYSTNGAGTIHSFELALTGASSESVRDALPKGEFGMAFETGAYLNYAIRVGVEQGCGYGESMGRLYCDADFRREVIERSFREHEDTGEYYKPYDGFPYAGNCVFAAAYARGVPACVHASLGTDIIDQHPSFDGAAKGAASGRDFLIFAEEMCRFTEGGVVLNIGTAIMGPEVLLKAVSMAVNVGKSPASLWTGDFDVRPFVFDDDVRDESEYYYYLRDQKSVATRIPKVLGGNGFYFQGMHRDTLEPLYQYIVRELDAG
ncbi:MAG: hypothetical protein JW909_03415 [Planctomycetes bacterium]|nr:hypothetical protein [Planctomycetota bacterium]